MNFFITKNKTKLSNELQPNNTWRYEKSEALTKPVLRGFNSGHYSWSNIWPSGTDIRQIFGAKMALACVAKCRLSSCTSRSERDRTHPFGLWISPLHSFYGLVFPGHTCAEFPDMKRLFKNGQLWVERTRTALLDVIRAINTECALTNKKTSTIQQLRA